MSMQTKGRNIVLVDSIISTMKEIQIDMYIDELLKVTKLIQTIFMYSSEIEQPLTLDVQNLLKNQWIVENNGSLEFLPLSYIEKESSLLSDFAKFYNKLHNNNQDFNPNISGPNFLNSFDSNLQRIENIKKFLEYLFTIKSPSISDRHRLILFEIVAEEYVQMLKDKDIRSLTVLGQNTVLTIVTKVYNRISNNNSLQNLPKGPLSHEIMRFFFVIKQLINNN